MVLLDMYTRLQTRGQILPLLQLRSKGKIFLASFLFYLLIVKHRIKSGAKVVKDTFIIRKCTVAISKKDVAKMKRAELQNVIKVYFRPKKSVFRLFFFKKGRK